MDTTHKVRIVTAASLFDGHDAAINVMRRIMQSMGAEIIHLGHNRSVAEIVECAIEEDANGIAITSYQGGHVEFFKYMKDLLNENGCGHIKIFGGGGGTILPAEIKELQDYGITRIYSPDDGRHMGLEGMIEDVINRCKAPLLRLGEGNSSKQPDYWKASENWNGKLPLGEARDIRRIARAITLAEASQDFSEILPKLTGSLQMPLPRRSRGDFPVLGITGTGGAGKSSVTDEIVRRFLQAFTDKTIAVISVDPSKKKTGGALLGDRIRMNSIHHPRAYMRSLATRESDVALSKYVQEAIDIVQSQQYDFIILESAGVGQSDASILDFCDASMYVMTPEYGAASQLEKINMLDYADVICINKFDKAGAMDAYNDVCKQYKRNHKLFTAANEDLPVIGTTASKFNDEGVNTLFDKIVAIINEKTGANWIGAKTLQEQRMSTSDATIIPAKRVRYLSEICEVIRSYNSWVNEQSNIASQLYQLEGTIKLLADNNNNI